MSEKLVFLEYLNRSGSTFLSQKLSLLDNVGVSIEAGYLNYNKSRFHSEIQNESDLREAINKLKEDRKFESWDVDLEDLAASMQKKLPFHFIELLDACMVQAHTNQLIRIYKGGDFYLNYNELISLKPECKIIFISRDPRGIYNSQLKSKRSYESKYMTTSVVRFVADFQLRWKRLNTIGQSSNLLIVSYEDLIAKEEIVITEICLFLGLERPDKAQIRKENGYFDKIPKDQQYLHQNLLKKKGLKSRIDGWKTELSDHDIYFLETFLRAHLESSKLEFHSKRLGLISYMKYALNAVYFWFYFSFKSLKFGKKYGK